MKVSADIARGSSRLFCRHLMAAALCMMAIGLSITRASSAHAQTPFYRAAGADLSAYPNGGLIRVQPIAGAPDGATAYRILYRSEGLRGEPIAVSGVVIVPAGAPSENGRPIVAWAHPTTGVVPICAPSLARVLFQSIQGLRDMLARGYVIAATDYPGLGTPGPHPYLVGTSEGRAVLDSVRAARNIPDAGSGRRFAVWGHSQGGQAVLFAGILAGSYAPELQLVGVAAAAPATKLATSMQDDLGTSGGNNLTAMTLWSWSRVYGAPMSKVVTPAAIPAINQLAGMCIERFFDILRRRGPSRMLQHSFLSVNGLAQDQPWRSLLAENTPGPLPSDIPVFLAQGTADHLVLPSVTRQYASMLCRAGSRVALDWLTGVSHGFSGRDSASAAVAWLADRFAGAPVPTSCGNG
jgi:alpha-beta hydrolase superfamily lysophospholipase